MADDEAEIAAFHRAARKRKAVIFAIAAVVSFAVGAIAIALAIALTAEAPDGGHRYEIRVLALSVVLMVAGVWSAVTAYRIGTGQIIDVD